MMIAGILLMTVGSSVVDGRNKKPEAKASFNQLLPKIPPRASRRIRCPLGANRPCRASAIIVPPASPAPARPGLPPAQSPLICMPSHLRLIVPRLVTATHNGQHTPDLLASTGFFVVMLQVAWGCRCWAMSMSESRYPSCPNRRRARLP